MEPAFFCFSRDQESQSLSGRRARSRAAASERPVDTIDVRAKVRFPGKDRVNGARRGRIRKIGAIGEGTNDEAHAGFLADRNCKVGGRVAKDTKSDAIAIAEEQK